MSASSFAVSSVLLVLLVLSAGIIVLQIYLSKRENRWLGLILPVISLCISLTAVFGIVSFGTLTMSSTTSQTADGGEFVMQQTPEEIFTQQPLNLSSVIFTMAVTFFTCNIPTIVLLGIYLACQEKRRRRKFLEKMSVQDLE